jgi:soluble lytic murein transglycosylase-like protein
MHLRQRSVQEYRAAVARRAWRRAVSRLILNRTALLLLLAAAGCVEPVTTARDDGERPLPETRAGDPTMPRIVSATLPGGPAHAYGSQPRLASFTMPLEVSAFRTIEDAWSRAFFGDRQRMVEFIENAAVINGLPVEFLTRLLRQESGLNHQAVSPAGALGVAQFMPATASERGLVDPFNPFEAIPKSAELLRDYRSRFGNLGFAAAAYNAGPQRVRDWLLGRSPLPRETRDYVAKITGRSAEDWRRSGDFAVVADPWAPAASRADVTLASRIAEVISTR